jgi:hypothetical protein
MVEQMLKEGLVQLDENGDNPITTGGVEYVAQHLAREVAGRHWNAHRNNTNQCFFRV